MQMHNLKVSTVDVNILFQFEPHFYFCCPDFKVLFNCLVQILPVSTKSIARTVTSEPPIHRAHILSWPILDLLQSPSLKVTSIFTKPLNPHSLHSTFLFTFTLTYKLFFVSVIFPTLNQSTTGLKFKSFSPTTFCWIGTEIVPRNFYLLYFKRVVHQCRPVLTSLGSMRTYYNLSYINICLEQQFPTCG